MRRTLCKYRQSWVEFVSGLLFRKQFHWKAIENTIGDLFEEDSHSNRDNEHTWLQFAWANTLLTLISFSSGSEGIKPRNFFELTRKMLRKFDVWKLRKKAFRHVKREKSNNIIVHFCQLCLEQLSRSYFISQLHFISSTSLFSLPRKPFLMSDAKRNVCNPISM